MDLMKFILRFRAVIPGSGDVAGPRQGEWKMQDSLRDRAVCVRSLACAREDAHCKGHDLTRFAPPSFLTPAFRPVDSRPKVNTSRLTAY